MSPLPRNTKRLTGLPDPEKIVQEYTANQAVIEGLEKELDRARNHQLMYIHFLRRSGYSSPQFSIESYKIVSRFKEGFAQTPVGTLSMRRAVLEILREAWPNDIHILEILKKAEERGARSAAKNKRSVVALICLNFSKRKYPLERTGPSRWRWNPADDWRPFAEEESEDISEIPDVTPRAEVQSLIDSLRAS